jgi:hypothetical protein
MQGKHDMLGRRDMPHKQGGRLLIHKEVRPVIDRGRPVVYKFNLISPPI